MFIELKGINGNMFLININNITDITSGVDNDEITLITMIDNGLTVQESYETVKELIKEEVAAERGY